MPILCVVSRVYSYINSAKQILEQYKGGQPFASFLKQYFAANKRYGSKDRKQVSHLCYCYFRLGKAGMNVPLEERILAGLFLCSNEANEILETLKPAWNAATGLPTMEKCSMLARRNFSEGGHDAQFSMFNVFPWKNELSAGIDHEKFCESFFIQPDLFLRLRPGNEMTVKKKLFQAGIQFRAVSEDCLALPNSSRIDTLINLNREAVVQDLSSQRVGEFMTLVRRGPSDHVWDCCAGSGGKSIMLHDLNPDIDLTVSDVRESILANLKKRFKQAELKNYKSFVADLSGPGLKLPSSTFNLIIADVPCSGSGTWSRTPEQLYYFDADTIDEYATLQQKIISNTLPHLQPGGYLLYVTCSVFQKENEQVVDFIKEKFHLELIKMELLKGYDKKADTMFAALLSMPK